MLTFVTWKFHTDNTYTANRGHKTSLKKGEQYFWKIYKKNLTEINLRNLVGYKCSFSTMKPIEGSNWEGIETIFRSSFHFFFQ